MWLWSSELTASRELQSVLEKLKALLPSGQTGNEDQTTTFAELATSLDAVFKTTLVRTVAYR
jgi:hypothetical protein